MISGIVEIPSAAARASAGHRRAESARGGEPALLHRGRGEAREADDVADSEDVVTAVRKCWSTLMRPRASASRPELSSPSLAHSPRRPAEYMTASAAIRLPLASAGGVAPSCFSTNAERVSPSRNTRPSAGSNCRASITWLSQNSEQPLVALDHGYARAERGEDRGVLDPDHPGADHDERRVRRRATILDSDGILNMAKIPSTLVVVGAGVIGIEYASIFAALGTRVTVVERNERLLEFCDNQVIEARQYYLRRHLAAFGGETVDRRRTRPQPTTVPGASLNGDCCHGTEPLCAGGADC